MLLFVNACLREDSRTERLARMWLERRAYEGELRTVSLSELHVDPLETTGSNTIKAYSAAVAAGSYGHPMFEHAKAFAQADEVLIAAPFWNYGLPALLNCYLELVCTQGLTFDVDETGAYVSLCKARRLTFVSTAGGAAPDLSDDHAFGKVRTLATCFWHIPQIEHVAAWGLDGPGADVEALLADAL
jgi:FMN-dependent NADH-azoreductase